MDEFEKDTWNGQMKVYYGNVLIYDGETKNGNYHGKGTLYDEQGNIVHHGEFIEGDIK